jgi:hypothetical protein
MKVTRVYADADGESRFEEREIELKVSGEIGCLSDPIPAKSVIFRENEAGYDFNWHVAPQRQFIILLDGKIEIETSLGEKRTFSGGEILLMEDTSGKGHRTRNVIQAKRHSVFIVLGERFSLIPASSKDTNNLSETN